MFGVVVEVRLKEFVEFIRNINKNMQKLETQRHGQFVNAKFFKRKIFLKALHSERFK